ncbi:bifunctional 6-phosphofructo-2-kinase/fructose-2,6-bisphosphate 2-phosphatase [Pholiota conissans]|uniref:Bifunctional 6-phosphofructo-2-kinase/fructose-2,6-bisphosphate 2-phosphatase n=1 Tax=Pholiota conissans TaxID=109636 RepID=A0A9P6D451_9AGAR|nr:bifunctional 6-phosphofructo-2-kinase/fructose-2,6-bisphosphate 2-phosphatase [Pholiota conissans]
MVAPLYTTASGLLFHAGKILVITIGLPARGKTHISRALERYLRWMGVKTQVISLGDYRRKTIGGAQKLPPDYFTLEGEKSPETMALRKKVSDGCEQLIWDYFESGGQVVIYDANNGTRAARHALAEKFDKAGIHVVMLESLCDNKEIIETNIRSVKISSPDYKGWDPDKAVEDYYTRIRGHEKYYEPLEERTWPYIKIINVGEKIILNNIQGYLQSRIVFFLMNIHNRFRTIYFARSGQSLIEHSYKADSDLSPAGWDYAEKLKDFVLERRAKSLEQRGISHEGRKLVIWTSTRRRAHHTAWPFVATSTSSLSTLNQQPVFSADTFDADTSPVYHDVETASPTETASAGTTSKKNIPMPSTIKVVEKPQMLEINPGIWDGLSPEQAKKYYPGDWDRFTKDPYSYRAPRAESYHDLSVRLEPVLIELEREQEDLLIIGHASVIRCLLAYLIGLPASEIPAIEIARGDLLEVVPASYGVHSHAFHFWDGPGRRGDGDDPQDVKDANNFYENYAESTRGKRKVAVEEVDAVPKSPDREAIELRGMQETLAALAEAEAAPSINIQVTDVK